MFCPPSKAEPLSDTEIVTLAHWMATLIMAYGFDIDKSPDNVDADEQSEEGDILVSDEEEDQITSKGMVPLADLLNASASNNNVWSFIICILFCFADSM